ncbi:MAG: ImmA/IrrE family metallo-endopeptidase [Phycisphaeraceae bacterium]
MTVRSNLGRQALRAAIRARRQAGVPEDRPLCVFNFAEEHHDVEVWFVDAPSLEGMYQKDSPGRIFVSSHRTPGRQAMTCAHELGHHIFGHGTQVDEYVENSSLSHNLSPDERLVRLFASFLLMPEPAIQRTFTELGASLNSPEPHEVLIASHYLGTSYEALVRHMHLSLDLIDESTGSRLLKTTRKAIVTNLVGKFPESELVVAGYHWESRAIDLSVGDCCLLPKGTDVEGGKITQRQQLPIGDLYTAQHPGTTRVEHTDSGWAAYVRISRARFSGRNIYRYMEDPDECG